LIKFGQGAPVCSWTIDQLVKKNLKIQIYEFLDLHQEFDSNFDFGLLGFELINGFDPALRP
jgi:hypothetical protein